MNTNTSIQKKVRLGLHTVELLGLVEAGGIRVTVSEDLLTRYANAVKEMNSIQAEFDHLLDLHR